MSAGETVHAVGRSDVRGSEPPGRHGVRRRGVRARHGLAPGPPGGNPRHAGDADGASLGSAGRRMPVAVHSRSVGNEQDPHQTSRAGFGRVTVALRVRAEPELAHRGLPVRRDVPEQVTRRVCRSPRDSGCAGRGAVYQRWAGATRDTGTPGQQGPRVGGLGSREVSREPLTRDWCRPCHLAGTPCTRSAALDHFSLVQGGPAPSGGPSWDVSARESLR